jgi:hypothetical protein
MKWLVLLSALMLSGSAALAQSSAPVGQGASQNSSKQAPSIRRDAPATHGIGSPVQGANDNALGTGASTGTAHPNTTGSSGTSGTNGVDSSTTNSH